MEEERNLCKKYKDIEEKWKERGKMGDDIQVWGGLVAHRDFDGGQEPGKRPERG